MCGAWIFQNHHVIADKLSVFNLQLFLKDIWSYKTGKVEWRNDSNCLIPYSNSALWIYNAIENKIHTCFTSELSIETVFKQCDPNWNICSFWEQFAPCVSKKYMQLYSGWLVGFYPNSGPLYLCSSSASWIQESVASLKVPTQHQTDLSWLYDNTNAHSPPFRSGCLGRPKLCLGRPKFSRRLH